MAKQLHCIIHPQNSNQYYALQNDGVLALCQTGQREPLQVFQAAEQLLTFAGYEDRLTKDENGNESRSQIMNTALPYQQNYTMDLLWPWLSVFQQYGTNGCMYNLETGVQKYFSRENYHADVSSFSNGLFLYQGQVCLLHQTQWNCLDITNLETGMLLTDREIYYRMLEGTDAQGSRKYEKKNYVDYFHGRIFFSPDHQYFVDTGWVWQPAGVPVLYRVEDFLTDYENSEIRLGLGEDFIFGDDWDQSAVWLDQNNFLLNFFPDLELLEETDLLANNNPAVLLQFNVTQIAPSCSQYAKEELIAEKVIPFPFLTSPVQSYNKPGDTAAQCYIQMLQVDLYWDEQEQLLLGIDGNELLVLDWVSGANYCLRYGREQCFYSTIHHQAYQLPLWPGNFPHAQIRALLNAARAFYPAPSSQS